METFWAIFKDITFKEKLLWIPFGQFFKKLGDILFRHLVTLFTDNN